MTSGTATAAYSCNVRYSVCRDMWSDWVRLNQGAFQFRQYHAHLPHGSARWGRGVNHFRERAAQPVELLDNEGITYRERLETAGQFRLLDMYPRGFLNKSTLASDLIQGGKR